MIKRNLPETVTAAVLTIFALFVCSKAVNIEPAIIPPNMAEVRELTPTATEAAEAKEAATGAVKQVVLYDVPLSYELQLYIINLCEEVSIEPTLVFAIIERESGYTVDAVGDNGNSKGLMQIQQKWHKERMDRLGCDNLFDPFQNVTVGVDILAELIGRGKGTEWALMAYNGGASYADKRTTSEYVQDIYEIKERLNKDSFVVERGAVTDVLHR